MFVSDLNMTVVIAIIGPSVGGLLIAVCAIVVDYLCVKKHGLDVLTMFIYYAP